MSTETWYQSFLTDCNTMQPSPVLGREDVQVYLLQLFVDCRILMALLYSGETDFLDALTVLHPTSDDLHCAGVPRAFRTQRLQIFKTEFACVVLLAVAVPPEELSLLFLL